MSLFDNDGDERVLKVMKAGDLLHYDYRPASLREGGAAPAKLSDTFRVVQWNIERGVKLDAIITTLKALNTDFIVLQELDINCRRSSYANVPRAIAEALEAELYFACEFQELDSPLRSPENAVGPRSQPVLEPETPPKSSSSDGGTPKSPRPRHFHGNAILSRRVTMREPAVVPHTTPIQWDEAGRHYKEPRRGFRSALRVCITFADRTSAQMAPLYLYCCHFEVFCGGLARVRQLADCMADMQRITRVATVVNGTSLRQPAFLLGGDLNTMAHGIVRCSRRYATDRLRWLSFGESEACWLQRKVLGRHMQSREPGCCPFSYRYPMYAAARVQQLLSNNALVWRYVYGFTDAELLRMANDKLCLYDPSDKATSITLDNPAYHGLVRGKFDWMLLSNLQPRPFRTSRGGAQPVDTAALQKSGSISPASYAAQYLQTIQDGAEDDEARERSVRPDEVATKHVPADGYLLFNEDYAASDHRGLVMTVRQNNGRPTDVYPKYGAPYTTSWTAIGFFALTRALPVALVGLAAFRKLRASQ